MGWKRLLVIIFFFPMVMTCQKMRHGKNMFTGAPRRASVSSVWSLWSTAECVEGKEQAVKGRAQEPPALMCSVGWAEDGGQIPVLICKELCTCVVHGSVYCGMGGSSFHLIHLAETEHKLSCLGSSCYRPEFFFFPRHENVLRQHRKTISHPAHPMRWKQLLSGSCCLLILALSEIITIGQKLTCFSDCSFSSLLALWDFLLIDKKPAASPVSVQRNCNALTGQTYLNSEMKWRTDVCFSSSTGVDRQISWLSGFVVEEKLFQQHSSVVATSEPYWWCCAGARISIPMEILSNSLKFSSWLSSLQIWRCRQSPYSNNS